MKAPHNFEGNINWIAGPFPYIPGSKLLRLSAKLERQYELTNPKARLVLKRIEKKFASLERKFRYLRAA
jgi:hypothetical protein